ncbi:helix-hairpin-helix domain-containing protein [Nocardiopsis sp. NPDC007018]|uniref:helix-hairpin-helix domain-containing protein n=1 Tax=Nocardiopsis sp. NPDC007018 TaxID=3155721 RepID=UPI0033D38219
MAPSRRSRRTPAPPDPEERLRTLGLDSVPGPVDPGGRSWSPSDPVAALPRPPYAVGADGEPPPSRAAGHDPGPHRRSPSPPGPLWEGWSGAAPDTGEDDPASASTVPTSPAGAPDGARAPSPASRGGPPGRVSGPGAPAARSSHDGARPSGRDGSTGRPRLPTHGRNGSPTEPEPGSARTGHDDTDHVRQKRGGPPGPTEPEPVRPPSGYTELAPESAVSALERVAASWGSRTALSRRAVAALAVLCALAVVSALLFLRERPAEVTVSAPEGGGAPAGGSAPPSPADGAEAVPVPDGEAVPEGDVVVHVGGEVAEPGLYTMPGGSRVADAVEEAGGALPDADLDLVNLARPLTDGERVLVGVPPPEGEAQAGVGGGPAPVDLNRADQSALETLPGIGEKKARQILAHREALGGSFGSVEDLLGVDGIAEKTFRTLEPHVTVG